MSEKACCPKCGSWASEVFYEQRHLWCGYNCRVQHRVVITATLEGTGYAEARFGGLVDRPTLEQVARAVRGFKDACAVIDGDTGNVMPQTRIETEVNGELVRPDSMWFGEIPKEFHARALEVVCPACRAIVGHGCIDTRPEFPLRYLSRSHRARVTLARSAAQNDKLAT